MKNYLPAKKSLGQHFLICKWVLSVMTDAANLSADDTILEIGPGTGVLTKALAARVKKIIAIEKDEALAAQLRRDFQLQKINNVEIYEGDILKKIPPLPKHYKIVANIPYYLTARLLRLFLEGQEIKPVHMVLAVQKEVAERICAKPPSMNLLGLAVQVCGNPRIVKTVPASCFAPRPNVDSAIISISDISDTFFASHHIEKRAFFNLLHLAFIHKRKKLVSALTHLAPKKDIEFAFQKIGISPNARPQELDKEQWALLAQKIS